mgnify:CR=1 FL=1
MRTSNVTYLVKKGISSIWKNFLMSFASFCILMVSLLLVSCAVLLMMNVNKIMSNIEDTNEITIYLKEDISDKQVEHIKSVLEKNQDITDVKYYSKEQALDDFRDNMAEYSELLDYLDKNPMPETFLVRVKDLSKIRHVVNTVNDIEGVEQTKAPYDFASVLVQIRNTFTLIGGAVLIALVVVSIVIVSNSIRTSVFARRNEISIMRSALLRGSSRLRSSLRVCSSVSSPVPRRGGSRGLSTTPCSRCFPLISPYGRCSDSTGSRRSEISCGMSSR